MLGGAAETKIVFSKFADSAARSSGEPAQDHDASVAPPNLGGGADSPSIEDTPHKPTTTSSSPEKSATPISTADSDKSSPKSADHGSSGANPSASPKGAKSSQFASSKGAKSSPSSSLKSSPPKGTKSKGSEASTKSFPSVSPKGMKSSPTATPEGVKHSSTSSPKGARSSPITDSKSVKSSSTASPEDAKLTSPPLSDEKQSPTAAVKQAWTRNDRDPAAPPPTGDGGNTAGNGESRDMTVEDIETNESIMASRKSAPSKEDPVYQLTAEEEVFSTPEAPEKVSEVRYLTKLIQPA